MLNKNYYKASVVLGLISIGYFITYPVRDSFWGGLVNSSLGAGMIGGLADWFAVSALFKHPFGIDVGTAVIPRNKEKLFVAIVDMVSDDLLSQENLQEAFADYDFSAVSIRYLDERGGREKCKVLLREAVERILLANESKQVLSQLWQNIRQNLESKPLTPIVCQAAEWSIKSGYADRVLNTVIDEIIHLVGEPKIKTFLVKLFVSVRHKYEQGMGTRQLFNGLMMELNNISPLKIAGAIQKEIISHLTEVRNMDNPVREEYRELLRNILVKGIATDSLFSGAIESLKFSFLECIEDDIELNKTINLKEKTGLLVDNFLCQFSSNIELKQEFNRVVRKAISQWMDKYHGEISIVIREKLEAITDDELVDILEAKVGNDLQIIRINGSLVGSMVGMVIYCLYMLINKVISYGL